MNYILNPSLEHVCLTKIAVQLWTADADNQVVDSFKSSPEMSSYDSNDFAKIKEKVESLPLPTHSKSQLLSFIKPIGEQISLWYYHLHNLCEVKAINVKELRWTSYGTIDRVKSAQLLLERDQSLDLKQRYILARTFCLVEQVQELLREEILKEERLPVPPAYSNIVRANEQHLVVYFAQYVEHCLRRYEVHPSYSSPYFQACLGAILLRDTTAAKYFFQRLSSEEKNLIFSSFREKFRGSYYLIFLTNSPLQFSADLVCFLLSQMSETQREEMLRTSSLCVLIVLIAWPYAREFLLQTVRQMKEFPQKSDFDHLVYSILRKIDKSLTNCEYRAMFFEFWRLSPVQHRTYFVDSLKIMKLYKYFNKGEVEICKLMLSEASAERKERMILDEESLLNGYYSLAFQKLRNYFQFFIEECGTSKEILDRFKTQLTAYFSYVDSEESREFLQFLDAFHPQQTE